MSRWILDYKEKKKEKKKEEKKKERKKKREEKKTQFARKYLVTEESFRANPQEIETESEYFFKENVPDQYLSNQFRKNLERSLFFHPSNDTLSRELEDTDYSIFIDRVVVPFQIRLDIRYKKYDEALKIINDIESDINNIDISQTRKKLFKRDLREFWRYTKTYWQERLVGEAQRRNTHQRDPDLDRFLPEAYKGIDKRIFPAELFEDDEKTLSKCKGPCMIQPQQSSVFSSSNECSCYTGNGWEGLVPTLMSGYTNWEKCPKSLCQYANESEIYKKDFINSFSDDYYKDYYYKDQGYIY